MRCAGLCPGDAAPFPPARQISDHGTLAAEEGQVVPVGICNQFHCREAREHETPVYENAFTLFDPASYVYARRGPTSWS